MDLLCFVLPDGIGALDGWAGAIEAVLGSNGSESEAVVAAVNSYRDNGGGGTGSLYTGETVIICPLVSSLTARTSTRTMIERDADTEAIMLLDASILPTNDFQLTSPKVKGLVPNLVFVSCFCIRWRILLIRQPPP